MTAILVVLVIIWLTILANLMFSGYVIMYIKQKKEINIPEKPVDLSGKELREFLEADREAAQGFHDAISNLNAFMTGITEEDSNVGEQEL